MEFSDWVTETKRIIRNFGVKDTIDEVNFEIDFSNGVNPDLAARAYLLYQAIKVEFPKPDILKERAYEIQRIAYNNTLEHRRFLVTNSWNLHLDIAARVYGFKDWKDYKNLRKQFNKRKQLCL